MRLLPSVDPGCCASEGETLCFLGNWIRVGVLRGIQVTLSGDRHAMRPLAAELRDRYALLEEQGTARAGARLREDLDG